MCVVVLTPAGVASSWVEYETNLAISRERQGQMGLLLLDVADCDAPFGRDGFQFLPFRGSYAAGLAALRARLDGGGGDVPAGTSRQPSYSPQDGHRTHSYPRRAVSLWVVGG